MKAKLLTFSCLVFLMMLFSVNIIFAQTELGTFKRDNCIDLIQSCANCTFVNITSVYYPNGTIAEANLSMDKIGTLYTKEFCNTSIIGTYVVNGFGDPNTQETVFAYSFKVTPTGKEESNSPVSLAIALFFIVMNIGLFMLYFIKQSFHDNKYTNFIIKRAILVISIYFTMFNLSIIGSLVAASNYDLMHQIYGLMDTVGWIGYTSIIILMLTTLFQFLNQLKYDKQEKRTGGDDYE